MMGIFNFIFAPFYACYRHRFLLFYTAITELKSMYAGSVLGLLWVVMGPLLFLTLYSLVYTVIFRIRPEGLGLTDYIFYVFCGLIPFLSFSQALTTGATAISRHRHVLLNTVFPAELLPIRTTIIAHVTLFSGFGLLCLVGLFFGKFSLWWVLLPFIGVLQILALSGVAFMLSLMTLALKDIEQILPYLAMLFMVVTPIAYTPDMVPSHLKIVCYLNPLFYFTQTFQYIFVFQTLPPLSLIMGLLVISLGTFSLGYWFFQKAKAVFYDMA